MANVALLDLDDRIIKAIKIMNSGVSSAADQIKMILDEAIKEKYGSRKPISVLSKLGSSSGGTPKKSSLSSVSEESIKKPKSFPDSKIKVASSKHISPSRSPSPPVVSIPENDEVEIKISDESSVASSDSRDSALEIVDEFNVCFVCKNRRGGSVTIGNKLIECAECHCSYHQDCHTPPISDSDAADPRLIWYCVSCMRKMNKKASLLASKTSSSSSKSSSSSSKPLFSSSSTSSSKYSTSSSTSKSNSGSKSSSSTSASKTTGSGGATTSSSLISADKRIQIMKKRAASKKPEPPKKFSKK